jgi:hypothetical protein
LPRRTLEAFFFYPISILETLPVEIVARRKLSFYLLNATRVIFMCVSTQKSFVEVNKKWVFKAKLGGEKKFYNEHLQQITMKFDYSTFLPHILTLDENKSFN